MTAYNLLAEPRSAGNEKTWETLVAKFPSEDHAAVSAAVVEAVVASATEGKMEMLHHGARTVVMPPRCCSTSSAPAPPSWVPTTTVNDTSKYSQRQSINHIDIEREEFGMGMTAFWRWIVDEPDALPPEFWQLVLQSSLTWGNRAGRFAWA